VPVFGEHGPLLEVVKGDGPGGKNPLRACPSRLGPRTRSLELNESAGAGPHGRRRP
jgi:hypothetical protein